MDDARFTQALLPGGPMSRYTSDAKSRSSKRAKAIHDRVRAEVYREIEAEADTDKQSRKRQTSQECRTRGGE